MSSQNDSQTVNRPPVVRARKDRRNSRISVLSITSDHSSNPQDSFAARHVAKNCGDSPAPAVLHVDAPGEDGEGEEAVEMNNNLPASEIDSDALRHNAERVILNAESAIVRARALTREVVTAIGNERTADTVTPPTAAELEEEATATRKLDEEREHTNRVLAIALGAIASAELGQPEEPAAGAPLESQKDEEIEVKPQEENANGNGAVTETTAMEESAIGGQQPPSSPSEAEEVGVNALGEGADESVPRAGLKGYRQNLKAAVERRQEAPRSVGATVSVKTRSRSQRFCNNTCVAPLSSHPYTLVLDGAAVTATEVEVEKSNIDDANNTSREIPGRYYPPVATGNRRASSQQQLPHRRSSSNRSSQRRSFMGNRHPDRSHDYTSSAGSERREPGLAGSPGVCTPRSTRSSVREGDFTAHQKPRSRSRSASVSVLDLRTLDRSRQNARQPGATQAEIKAFAYSLVDHHTSTLATWSSRADVAEAYVNKLVRIGGKRIPPRSEDRNFLERAIRSTRFYRSQLEDGIVLLQSQAESPPAEQASGSDPNWSDFCDRFCVGLQDLHFEATVLSRRINDMLSVPELSALQDFTWHMPRTSSTRGRSASAASVPSSRAPSGARSSSVVLLKEDGLLRGARSCGASRRSSARSSSRQRSIAHGMGSVTADVSHITLSGRTRPTVPAMNGHDRATSPSVRRGSKVIRGGSIVTAASSAAPEREIVPAPAVQSYGRASRAVQPGIRRSSTPSGMDTAVVMGVMPFSNGSTPRRQSLRKLHPDTIVRGCCEGSSAYDQATPYGRLSPPRINSENSTPRPIAASSTEKNSSYTRHRESTAAAAAMGSTAQRHEIYSSPPQSSVMELVVVHSDGSVTQQTPELVSYVSPRGRLGPSSPPPLLDPERRTTLLRTIEQFEESGVALHRDDLRRARECFTELYGYQRGMRQYCDWIDDLALRTMRKSK